MGSLMLGLERANHIMTTYFSIFSKFIFQIVFYDVVRKISDKYFLRVGIFAWSSGKRPRVGIVSSVWSIGKRARVVARSIGKRPRVGKISSVWSIGKRARVVAWSSDKRPTSFLKKNRKPVKKMFLVNWTGLFRSTEIREKWQMKVSSGLKLREIVKWDLGSIS